MKKAQTLLAILFCLSAAAPADDVIAPLRRKLATAAVAERGAVAAELALALTARADGEHDRRETKAALATYLEALALLERYPGPPPSPHLLNRIGLDELILGDYENALRHLLRGLATAEGANDPVYITRNLYHIGYVHRDLGNYDLALEHFERARQAALVEGNQRYVIMALNEIGNVHVMRRQFAAALVSKESSLALARKHGEAELLANCLHDMGELLLREGDAARALPLVREALAIDRKLNHKRGIVLALFTVADCQQRLGRANEAIVALDEARLLAEKEGQDKDLSDILRLSSVVHEARGDLRQALAFQRRYQELRERLFNEEKTRQTAEMQTRFQVEKKQRENELLKQEKKIAALALGKQRSQRDFLFFAALLVLLLAGALLLGFRSKARANRWLEEANSRIAAQQGKLEKAYYQMEELARRDQLTGLPNRRAALEAIEREEKRFQRSNKPFSLVMSDLDGFKTVNDTLGHDAGDFVLREAAGIFTRSLRAQDMVARWGGDEFLFLLPETDAEGARVIGEAVKERIAGHDFRFARQALKLTMSTGAATFRSGLSAEDCLREADQAMYRSRGNGRPETPRS